MFDSVIVWFISVSLSCCTSFVVIYRYILQKYISLCVTLIKSFTVCMCVCLHMCVCMHICMCLWSYACHCICACTCVCVHAGCVCACLCVCETIGIYFHHIFFSVESLITAPVNSYSQIDNRIQEGTRNRTVASTNMNATSRSAWKHPI